MSLKTVESAPQSIETNYSRKSPYYQEHATTEMKRFASAPRTPFILNTNDISGAQASTTTIYTNLKRTNNFYNTNDVDGTHPSVLIPKSVSPSRPNNRIISNDDILGSKPQKNRLHITRHLNPLVPEYQLPKSHYKPATPPKHLRDTNKIDDIDGTKAKKILQFSDRIKTRDVMHKYDDVMDKTTGYKVQPRREDLKEAMNPLEVNDINDYRIFHTKRLNHNPLQPTYKVNGRVYDVPDGTSPSKHFGNSSRTPFSLRTDDIPDLKAPHEHHVGKTFPVNRRQIREINKIDDIISKTTNFTTMKTTSRSINPLDPKYKFLQ